MSEGGEQAKHGGHPHGEGAQKGGGRPMPGTGGMGSHEVDVFEYGGEKDGERQKMNRRLFFQLLVFDTPSNLSPRACLESLGKALDASGIGGVIYEDAANPKGLGLLTFSEDPDDFVTKVRPIFAEGDLRGLVLKPEFTMMGRTYSSGYEDNLVFWLIERPQNNVLGEETPWAVWYPLRRSGAFARLPGREQGGILREHAVIGRAYGEAGLATDIRLACHGIDMNDNEFVIGLIGKELYPLSHVVQTMRKTRQTSEYIVQMGPFFVGRVAHRSRPA
ncbi:MAG: chlorite dismutase family protein [Polyangiaceae bacterium]